MAEFYDPSQENADLSSSTLRDLNMRVTSLIFATERLDPSSVDPETIFSAWAEVSRVEEMIAEKAESDVERQFAQRGAVMAAQKSGDADRMTALFEKYGSNIWVTEPKVGEPIQRNSNWQDAAMIAKACINEAQNAALETTVNPDQLQA